MKKNIFIRLILLIIALFVFLCIVTACDIDKKSVAVPVFYPGEGTYNSIQSVKISCATEGAQIFYTTDGSNPVEEAFFYEDEIVVDRNMTLKARAACNDYEDSAISIAEYIINLPPSEMPQFSLLAGTYYSAQTIELSCDTNDAQIFYTLDGNDPTINSLCYTDGILLDKDDTYTIRAISVCENPPMPHSNIAEAEYIIDLPRVATPEFNPTPGTYPGTQVTVIITCVTADASIHFTSDGMDPWTSSTQYTDIAFPGGFVLSTFDGSPKTLKAIAFKEGYQESEIAIGIYEYIVR